MQAQMTDTSDALARLQKLLGDKGFIADAADMEPYLREERGTYHGAAKAVRAAGLDGRSRRGREDLRRGEAADLSARRQYRPRRRRGAVGGRRRHRAQRSRA